MLVGHIASVHAYVGHARTLCEHVLAARYVVYKWSRHIVPCDVPVYMRSRKILYSGTAKLFRRRRKRMPYYHVRAVRKRIVSRNFQYSRV